MLLALAASVTAAFAGTPIAQSELPEAAQKFIAQYFPNEQVRKVEKDTEHNRVEYEVDFASGAEVDFRSDGQWKEVKAAKGEAVHADLVPAAIAKYVAENHEGLYIKEISRKRGGYEVELSNGKELKLTEDAKPLQERSGQRPHNR